MQSLKVVDEDKDEIKTNLSAVARELRVLRQQPYVNKGVEKKLWNQFNVKHLEIGC